MQSESNNWQNHFLLLGVFKSSLNESRPPSLSSLRILLLKLLGLLLTVEGKRCPSGRGLSEGRCDKSAIRPRLTRLLDNSDGCERGVDMGKNTDKERERGGVDSTGSSGSELCSVLLGVYDNAPSRKSSEILDEEQALVSAVLSSLLALSHSAKTIALQGKDRMPFFILSHSC